MSVIANKLDDYSNCLRDIEVIEALILDTPEGRRLACLKLEAEELAKGIKDSAKHVPLSQAHTLIGRLHQLVWYYPKAVYSIDRLVALAQRLGASDADLSESLDDKPGYWSLRKRGKGG
jgi:hypothetical protein